MTTDPEDVADKRATQATSIMNAIDKILDEAKILHFDLNADGKGDLAGETLTAIKVLETFAGHLVTLT